MNTFSLIKNTNAYKIFKLDKENQTLSHAYLFVCEDGEMLDSYLSVFAKALLCSENEPCNNCRVCNLIDSKTHSDVVFYPTGSKIVTGDIDDLIEKSYYKPLELDKKVFILKDASTMTVQAQNKLLKTLEEPPKNTFILMGTSSIYPLLSTILSRCKRLDILPFLESELLSFLNESEIDSEKLHSVIRLSNGKLSEVLNRMKEVKSDGEDLAAYVLTNLKSSKQVAEFSSKIKKEALKDFVSSLGILVNNALNYSLSGTKIVDGDIKDIVLKIVNEVSIGALIYISDKVCEAEKALHFNGNFQAVVDNLLFGILEGKYKWSK